VFPGWLIRAVSANKCEQRFGGRSPGDHCGGRACAGANGGAIEQGADPVIAVAVNGKGIGPDLPPVNGDIEFIMYRPKMDGFSHGGTAINHTFNCQKTGTGRQFNLTVATKPGAIEQDCFLRQPKSRGAIGNINPGGNIGVGSPALVNPFGSLGGERRGGAGLPCGFEGKRVAVGHAAGGIDGDGFENLTMVVSGEANFGRAGLEKIAQHSNAITGAKADFCQSRRPFKILRPACTVGQFISDRRRRNRCNKGRKYS